MKKLWIPIVAVMLIAILFLPIPGPAYKDGGTREYTALTYKIVDWNRLTADDVYTSTEIYWFPENFQSIDDLWAQEEEHLIHKFTAIVLELSGDSALVQPVEGEDELRSSDKISFNLPGSEELGITVGSTVDIWYRGGIMESYPARIQAEKWALSDNLRHLAYDEPWLDKETAEKYDHDVFEHIVITKIYSNCFFARTVIPMPYEIKLNGHLSGEWCVGDQVYCNYENTYYDDKNQRIECDMLSVEASDWAPDEMVAYKPVIYLYPEVETEVFVRLNLDGRLTCTYPAYHNGWQVTAAPDSTLTDESGQTYNYLYWEGTTNARWDMTEGFCVKGTDTAAFLEDALEKLGLNRREANEFIVYWLPLMEQNPYNIIAFQTDVYTDAAQLEMTPAPDTLIRVFMTWQSTENYVNLQPQELTAPERTGFTVIEWGGSEIN